MTRVLFGGKSPAALPWHPLPYMEEYLRNLEVDGRADTYVKAVRLGLTRLALFLESEGVRHPDEITRTHILNYQAFLLDHDPELAVSYRQQMMKYARGWINWLSEVEYIDRNPWVRIRIGRAKKKPKPIEWDEVQMLFAAHRQQAFTMPPFFFHRREVIITLLLGWGLRVHELQALNVAQMDMRLDWVTARNKGGTEKVLPYADAMKGAVLRYLTHRGKHAREGEDALLIDQQGDRMTTHRIYKTVIELGDRAGVTLTPHRLRDTFGTLGLDGDIPPERLMKIFGHSSRAQTMEYSRVNNPKVKESHDEVFEPLLQELLGGVLP